MTKVLSHPDLVWFESGQSAIGGDLVGLYKALDRRFVELGRSLKVKEFSFPSFIELEDLKRIDYLHSFPHLATFPVSLDSSEANIAEFRREVIDAEKNTIKLTKLSPVHVILTPAACYHFYIRFKKQTLNEPLYLTTRCTCFRHEDYYVPLERQWNFSMREIVCIGSMTEVQNFVDTMKIKVNQLLSDIHLNLQWETASDPFFDPSNNPKALMQKLQPNKVEMLYQNRLAIGSVNSHRNYFGEAYEISRNGEPAYSACVAFGVDRWIAAFLHEYGTLRRDWPIDCAELT